jgi:peptidoglycan hydrolase-like protein with peptidoglycan-binding domain
MKSSYLIIGTLLLVSYSIKAVIKNKKLRMVVENNMVEYNSRALTCSLSALVIVWLAGCNSLVRYNSDIIYHPENSVSYTFQSSYEKTWDAVVNSALESGTIAGMDREKGIITTDRTTVGIKQTDMEEYALSRQPYTYTYILKLTSENDTQTRVGIEVELFQDHSTDPPAEKNHRGEIENSLRMALHKKICTALFPAGTGACRSDYADADMAETVAETPVKPPVQKFNPRVQSAQKALAKAGYNPGPADGLMGTKTRKALNRFQKDNNLATTWSLNNQTYTLLAQLPRPEPDKPAPPKVPPVHILPVPAKTPVKMSKKTTPEKKDIPPPTEKISPPPVSPPIATATDKPESGYITTDDTDLLAEQDLFGAEILDTVPAGTLLDVLAKNSEYYKIQYNEKVGYIYLEFVRKSQ